MRRDPAGRLSRRAMRKAGSLAAVGLAGAAILGAFHAVNDALEPPPATGQPVPAPHVETPTAPRVVPGRGFVAARISCRVEAGSGNETCGLSPPVRKVGGGRAYKATTVAGESFWIVLPDEFVLNPAVVVVPDAPIGGITGRPRLGTGSPLEVVRGLCARHSPCVPTRTARIALPNGGALTRWRLGPAAAEPEVATVEMGGWVLALPDEGTLGELIAMNLLWHVDGHGYLRLQARDVGHPIHGGRAGIRMFVPVPGGPDIVLAVRPGCRLSALQAGLEGRSRAGAGLLIGGGSVPGGRWCVGGDFRVEASNLEGERLTRLYEGLAIVPVR